MNRSNCKKWALRTLPRTSGPFWLRLEMFRLRLSTFWAEGGYNYLLYTLINNTPVCGFHVISPWPDHFAVIVAAHYRLRPLGSVSSNGESHQQDGIATFALKILLSFLPSPTIRFWRCRSPTMSSLLDLLSTARRRLLLSSVTLLYGANVVRGAVPGGFELAGDSMVGGMMVCLPVF